MVEQELASIAEIYLSHPIWARRITVLIGSPLRLSDLRRARASNAHACFIHSSRTANPDAAVSFNNYANLYIGLLLDIPPSTLYCYCYCYVIVVVIIAITINIVTIVVVVVVAAIFYCFILLSLTGSAYYYVCLVYQGLCPKVQTLRPDLEAGEQITPGSGRPYCGGGRVETCTTGKQQSLSRNQYISMCIEC